MKTLGPGPWTIGGREVIAEQLRGLLAKLPATWDDLPGYDVAPREPLQDFLRKAGLATYDRKARVWRRMEGA